MATLDYMCYVLRLRLSGWSFNSELLCVDPPAAVRRVSATENPKTDALNPETCAPLLENPSSLRDVGVCQKERVRQTALNPDN